MTHTISIITATFNSVNVLSDALNSLLNQTYANYECIIIDGGSTDGTIEIIKAYEPLFQRKLKWISEPDNGIYDAWNKGLKMAKGDIVGILNSDDIYLENALSIINETFVNNNIEIAFGDIVLQKATFGEIFEIEVKSNINLNGLIKGMSIMHPSVFVKKTWYEKEGKFDTSYRISSDYEFVLRSYLHGASFVYYNKVSTIMRTGGASDSLHRICETFKIRQKYSLLRFPLDYVNLFIQSCQFMYQKYRRKTAYSILSPSIIRRITKWKWLKLNKKYEQHI